MSYDRTRIEIGTEVIHSKRGAAVVRGRPGKRRIFVIVDERMNVRKIVAELRKLADRIEAGTTEDDGE